MLSLMMNILRNPASIEYQMIMRQLAIKKPNGHLFINRIQEILEKYNLGTVEGLAENVKTKGEWKNTVKSHQNNYWYDKCINDQDNKPSLCYLQVQEKPMNRPHNIWQSVGNDQANIRAAEVKARLVTQTYMLQTIRSKHNTNISPICTLCHNEDEDIQYFLLRCTCLINTRTSRKYKITLVSLDMAFIMNWWIVANSYN